MSERPLLFPNAKIPIKTTLKVLDTWLTYVKDSGWVVRKHQVSDTMIDYYSDDAPGYGKLTPLASVFRDNNNRPTVWIYIRLPMNTEKFLGTS